jgi:hypothetical protein
VDLAWQAGTLTEARLRSLLGRPVVVRCADREIRIETQPGRVYDLAAQLRE